MLNVDNIEEGVVLDHIKAGNSMKIYHYLGLADMDCTVAIIKNCRSGAMGTKDIVKIECNVNELNLDAVALVDPSITVDVIHEGKVVEKRKLRLPSQVKNILRCHNPRCISSIEQGLPHIFYRAEPDSRVYRCLYCDEKFDWESYDNWK